MITKTEIIINLNRMAEQFAREHPDDYHNLQGYRDIIDIRSEMENEPDHLFQNETYSGELLEQLKGRLGNLFDPFPGGRN